MCLQPNRPSRSKNPAFSFLLALLLSCSRAASCTQSIVVKSSYLLISSISSVSSCSPAAAPLRPSSELEMVDKRREFLRSGNEGRCEGCAERLVEREVITSGHCRRCWLTPNALDLSGYCITGPSGGSHACRAASSLKNYIRYPISIQRVLNASLCPLNIPVSRQRVLISDTTKIKMYVFMLKIGLLSTSCKMADPADPSTLGSALNTEPEQASVTESTSTENKYLSYKEVASLAASDRHTKGQIYTADRQQLFETVSKQFHTFEITPPKAFPPKTLPPKALTPKDLPSHNFPSSHVSPNNISPNDLLLNNPSTKMPYNNTAIPPPEEVTGSAALPCERPVGRLRTCSVHATLLADS